MNEHGKPKFVAKADPLSSVRNKKVDRQKFECDFNKEPSKQPLVSNILIVAAFKAAIYEDFLFRIFRRP